MSPAMRRLIRVALLNATGSVTVNGSLDLGENTTFPTLTVDGTLEGSSAVTVTGALTLDEGSLDGPGTVTVNSSGSLQVSGDYYNYIAGSLVNKGTGTIQANTLLSVEAGGSFDNAGSLQLNDDSYLYGDSGNASQESESGTTPAVPGGVLTNTGSITIDSASNYPATLGSGTGINNQGAITVSSGVLQLSGYPLETDTLDTSTILESPSTIDSGATLTVASGAALNVTGNATVDSGGALNATGSVTVNGSLDLGENTTFPTLTVDGTLEGSSAVTVTGALTLDEGSLDGPGTVTVNSSGSLQVSGDYYNYIAGSLVNKGTGTIQANTLLSVEAGGSFDNAGSLQLNDDSYLYGDSGNASQESESGTTPAVPGGVLTNTGSITIDSASNYPATLGSGTGINNQGAITVSSGVLQLSGYPLETDTLDTSTILESPSTIDSGATLTVASGAALNVTGNATVDSGGALNATGSVTVNGSLDLGENTTFPTLTVDGTLEGSSAVTVTGALTLDEGSLDGPGTVTVNSSGSLQVSGDYYNYIAGSLVNKGTGTIQANTLLSVEAGGSFDNAGSLQLNDDSYLYGDSGNASQESESGTTPAVPGGVLTNTGSITIDSASNYPATLGSGTGINNQGAITVSSGVLQLSGYPLETDTLDTSTILESPSTIDSGATLTVASGAALNVTGNATVDSGGALNATGSVTVNGSLDLGENTTFPTLTVDGTLEIAPQVTVHATMSAASATLELDANAPGQFGQFVVNNSVSLSNLRLDLNPSYTPGCGTAVTALTASSVSGAWDGVSGPAPSGGTWEPTTSSDTAGAYIYCPPPPRVLPRDLWQRFVL